FDADLNAAGWSLVSPAGARQRGWGADARVELASVIPWVASAIGEAGATTAGAIAAIVAERHGEVPTPTVLQAIDRITQEGRAMTFVGDPAQVAKPDKLVYGSAAILH